MAPAAAISSLSVHELLTGWLSNARGLREPETLGDWADYASYLEAAIKARADADALCDELRGRLAQWIDSEARSELRPLNRLTPPG